MTGFTASAVQTFTSRLATLDALLAKAASQMAAEKDEPDALAHAQLAPDMLPLGTQVAFACNQANQFADFAAGNPPSFLPRDGHDTLADCHAMIADSQAKLAAMTAGDDLAAREKIVSLGKQGQIPFTGATYLADWLLPNFYFHLVTAYAILRMKGIAIGKQDYMAYLAPAIEPAAA